MPLPSGPHLFYTERRNTSLTQESTGYATAGRHESDALPAAKSGQISSARVPTGKNQGNREATKIDRSCMDADSPQPAVDYRTEDFISTPINAFFVHIERPQSSREQMSGNDRNFQFTTAPDG